MLNELYQVSQAMEQVGIVYQKRHPRITPMGKNRKLLIVRLDDLAEPYEVEFIPGHKAGRLFRVKHGSEGSSFPGFNIPTPLLQGAQSCAGTLASVLERLCDLWEKENPPTQEITQAITEMAPLTQPRGFTPAQSSAFKRSMVDLVQELQGILGAQAPGLTNFTRLVDMVASVQPSLDLFRDGLTKALLHATKYADRDTLELTQRVLFGVLHWKGRSSKLGEPDYWEEKKKQDKKLNNANQPIYLDVAKLDHAHKAVAHTDTSNAINDILIQRDAKATHQTVQGEMDAFGNQGPWVDKYPTPKVAKLGDVKLFSVNTSEIKSLDRYGLKGSNQFSASTQAVQKMNDALLYLGDEKKEEGVTWQGIPGNRRNKSELLIAYLHEAPDCQEELAELFGGQAEKFSDPDFSARTQPVLDALEGKLQGNSSLKGSKVRLLALGEIDKGRKQISLYRSFRVQDIVDAARKWKTGAVNTPPVSIWFCNRRERTTDWKSRFVPHPLELTSVINQVWSSDPKSGFRASFQRAVTTSDAYDVFFADGLASGQKTHQCLTLLLHRTSPLFTRLGGVKTTRSWTDLSDSVRWQSRKAISLLGILLQQLGHSKDQFMQGSTYQIGRLLALVDGLHFQYCKWVRTSEEKRKKGAVEAPSELLGNALLNFALDDPTTALARLAERIRPYKGWADTYSGEDAGLVHWFARQMSDCEHCIDITALPERMEDVHKAQLLLGYLADHPKSETKG